MKRKLNFRAYFLMYFLLLLAGCAAVLIYIHALLQTYEEFRPLHYVKQVQEELAAQAAAHELAAAYGLELPEVSEWEADGAFWEKYDALFTDTLEVRLQKTTEKSIQYLILNGEFPVARVTLQAKGEAYTRLVILQFQEWEVASVELLFAPRSYEIVLPKDYRITLNGKEGKPIETNDADLRKYNFDNLYLKPEISIENGKGEAIEVAVTQDGIKAIFYEYRLVLPAQIKLYQDDVLLTGTESGNGMCFYRISEKVKPEVRLEDLYGNVVSYDGKSELVLTHFKVKADENHTVMVEGKETPQEIRTLVKNADYAFLESYVEGLPMLGEWEIAILKENPDWTIRDASGAVVQPVADAAGSLYSVEVKTEQEVPEAIAKEVDVLANAKKWSLFMSRDLEFSAMSPMLLKDSYQYEVARKYATGVDITFTSPHTLKNPPFTEEKVTNFVQITPDCFSVDISFVKHMSVGLGKPVDDAMNDRFFYVKEKEGGKEAWKLAGMKEIVNDGK